MADYKIEPFDLVKCLEFKYYKLIINGKCQFDDFFSDVLKNAIDKSNMKKILSLMELFSNKRLIPKQKFNSIKGVGRSDVFEFKTDNLRVYVVKQTPNMYIILGGYKKNQSKDIENLKNRIKNFNPKDYGQN